MSTRNILPEFIPASRTDSTTWGRFVDEYIKDFSAANAYLRVYGGSFEKAKRNGPRMIRENGWVRNEIARRSEGRITLADVTPERITLELARIALFDARKTVAIQVVEEDGETKLQQNEVPLAMLDDDTARGITGISYDVRGNRVLKNDKTAALQTLARLTTVTTLSMNKGRAGAVDHEAADEDEIVLMLEEFNTPDPDDEDDIGEEIEGEYVEEE